MSRRWSPPHAPTFRFTLPISSLRSRAGDARHADGDADYFFEHSSDLLCVVDGAGVVRRANPAFRRATGWSADAPHDATFAALVVAADRPDRRISWQLSAPDARGRVRAIGRDVTERETTADALRASEARYQHIAANVPGVVYQYVYRPDGSRGYTFVSEGARALFGVAPEAALADPDVLLRLIHPDELAQFVALARHAADTQGAFRWEGRVVLPSGEERFVQVVARDYRQPDGTVVSDGLMMDITELHRASRRFEESEQRYRSLFAHNPDGVYSLDREMRFTSANPACETITGWSAEELIAGAASPIVVEEDQETAVTAFRDALEGRAVRIDVSVRHRSGQWVRLGVTNVPIVVGGQIVGVFGIAKDLTAQRGLEDQLRQAQKMEAVGKLAGGIAHDFNNLLMVIQSFGGFLADGIATGSERREDLSEMLRAAERAQELTRQLLAFGRQQVLRPRRLDANETVAGVAAMLRRIIGEDIALVTEFEAEPRTIVADPGQIEQVLMNLAVNARDAMPNGGTLRLRTQNRVVHAAPSPHDAGRAAGRYVALIVEDEGAGIPANVLPRIFEPFFTTKPVGQGTGLGLATVYGIVEQSGGFVTVDSTPGHGSRFTVLLPAVDAPAAAPVPGLIASLPAGAETILLVEDEAQVRSAVRRMLERLGYTVREASTGAEALRAVEDAAARAERIDLVLTDLVMPELGGHALGERLAATHPEIHVLYMSGYTDDEIFRRGVDGAQVRFLGKPFTIERLAHAVREALGDAAPERDAAR